MENKIKSETVLFATTDEEKKVGKKELPNFTLSRPMKALNYLIENTCKIKLASKHVFSSKQTHMEVIRVRSHERCTNSCNGE